MKELLQDQGGFELAAGSTLVNSKYTVLGKVGSGPFSSVYAVSTSKGQKQIIRAVKVEKNPLKEQQIRTQVTVLKTIKDTNPDEMGFAQLYEFGYEPTFNFYVMTLLGPNLEQLMKLCGGAFSLKTTTILALQALDRLEVLHGQGYVHGDVAPQNFAVGLNSDSPFLFMIDFGRCKKYKDTVSSQHISYKENVVYPFNSTFASVNAHNNVQYSRRDDIESFLYMVLYLRLGKLPWAKANESKRVKGEVNIEEIKKKLTPEVLCRKMPLEVIDLMYYIKSIEFYEKPDYDFIRKILYRCLERESFDNNVIYDWNLIEEIDFKVYGGQPKIVLKTAAMVQNQLAQNVEPEELEEEDERAKLVNIDI